MQLKIFPFFSIILPTPPHLPSFIILPHPPSLIILPPSLAFPHYFTPFTCLPSIFYPLHLPSLIILLTPLPLIFYPTPLPSLFYPTPLCLIILPHPPSLILPHPPSLIILPMKFRRFPNFLF